MFRFEHPEFFWLALLTLLIAVFVMIRYKRREQDLAQWGSQSTARRLSKELFRDPRLLGLVMLSFILLTLAAVNPQWGTRTRTVEGSTGDIYILFDISNSMLAEDIAPNRLERARKLGLDIAESFRRDRIGLILFAGNAYLQSPLTTDWNAIQLYLTSAHPDQAGTQGTSVGKAIRLVGAASEEEEESQGALIIITDGEDHDSDALTAMQEAATKGWTSYVIGVGTENGATIPMVIDRRKDVKRDESGQPVITKINRSFMQQLAQAGNGRYFDVAESSSIVSSLKEELSDLERSRKEKRSFSEHVSYYQWFLVAALAILMLVPLIRYKYDVV